MLITYHHHPLKAPKLTHKYRLQAAISVLECFKASRSPSESILSDLSCFAFNLLSYVEVPGSGGKSLVICQTITFSRLPLWGLGGHLRPWNKVERIHTPSFFFSTVSSIPPLTSLFYFLLTFCLFLFLSMSSTKIERTQGFRGRKGRKTALFSFYLSMCAAFNVPFNIMTGESEI